MPDCNDKDLVIYKPKQASGTYADGDYYGYDADFANLANAKPATKGIVLLPADTASYIC